MKKDNKERLFEIMGKIDKSFKPKLNENLDEYRTDDSNYFPITTPVGSEDDKLFVSIVNQGIDSHLEGFTKSKFTVENTSIGKRRVFNFHVSELPILLRRLEELGTDEALSWKEDIENYDSNINEVITEVSDLDDDLVEYDVPSWALSALINGDYSGLNDEDEEKLNNFVNGVVNAHGNAHFIIGDMDGEDNLGFRSYNDIDNLGSDVYRVYIRPDKQTDSTKMPFNKRLTGGEYYLNENDKSQMNNLVRDQFELVSKYYNENDSTFEEGEEGSYYEIIFDIPKSEMTKQILDYFNEEHNFDSHGVGGNPGGMTSKSYVKKYNKGDKYRIVVDRRDVMDI